jgi:hypothetical protein
MFVTTSQRSDMIARQGQGTSTNTFTAEGLWALDTVEANWPTDGYRILYTTAPTFAFPVGYLALKGTFTAMTGNGVAPTSGTPPVTQDLDHGSPPKVALLFGWNLVANTAVDVSSADLGGLFIGAGDGTTELVAGITDDDAALDSVAKSYWSDAKVVQNYDVVPTLQSEADGSIVGDTFRLSWNDIDTVAREYQWLTLGNAPAVPTSLIYAPAPMAAHLVR